MSLLPACMSGHHMSGALGGQKKLLDLLELDLKFGVSYCMGPGNQTWVLCRSSKCS